MSDQLNVKYCNTDGCVSLAASYRNLQPKCAGASPPFYVYLPKRESGHTTVNIEIKIRKPEEEGDINIKGGETKKVL